MGIRATGARLAVVALALAAAVSTVSAPVRAVSAPTPAPGSRAVTPSVLRGAGLTTTGIAAQVAAAARLAGHPVTRVDVPRDDDPVRVLVQSASAARLLQERALAAMTPAAWSDAAAGAAATAELAPTSTIEGVSASHTAPFEVAAPAWADIRNGLDALRVDTPLLWQASYTVAAGVDRAVELLERRPRLASSVTSTPLGDVVVDARRRGCDSTYDRRVFVIVDTCGDDVYEAPAGGADTTSGLPIAIVVDTDGIDVTEPGPDGSGLPAVGGARNGGIAFAVDTTGDDIRSPNASGSLLSGAGRLAGFGFLFDHAGDDAYQSSGSSEAAKNGAGHFGGVGVLVDRAGDDTYSGDSFGQGSAWFGDAFGALVDLAGDDHYTDTGSYSQASAGAGGIAVLVDRRGNDTYEAYGRVTQGAGACGGAGTLADLAGNDVFNAAGGLGQGFATTVECGVDLGSAGTGRETSGMLTDARGNDEYVSSVLAQGAALGSGAGVLRDLAGDDAYRAYACAQGFVDAAAVRARCAAPAASGLAVGTATIDDRNGSNTFSLVSA